jgi:multidrug efflux pump subunit AcrB
MKFTERFNLSRIAIQNPAITVYLLITLLLAGIAAYVQLGQDEDPPFAFRVMVIRAFWPGATGMQMAEQVTDKLEKTLQEVPYVDHIRSYSKPGETTVIIELKDYSPPKEIPQIWYTVRKKIGDMAGTLPPGVQGPFFNDDFADVYGVMYALSADGFTQAQLKDYADGIRQEFLHTPSVAKVEYFGVQNENIFVEVSQKKLASMGIDINQVIAAIGQQNAVTSTGVLHTASDDFQVRIAGQFNAVADLSAMPLTFAGRTFRLGDIATVSRGYQDPTGPLVFHNGKPVIALGVSMVKGGDIIELGKQLRAATEKLHASLPVGIELTQIEDQPGVVSTSVHEFLRTLAEALIIVLAVSFLALGLHRKPLRIDVRPGLVVALSIPFVLAITFLVMKQTHIDLHKISLGSLIIALGLLVDDAIIIVEMMTRKLEEGYDKLTASTYAYTATAMPMLTGTLITAAGFLPIGLANSAVGEYTFAIFAVTTSALLISWLVSVYFVPFLGFRILKAHDAPRQGEPHEMFNSPFYERVRRTVDWCVQHRWLTIAGTGLALLIGIGGMAVVEQQFFPDSNRLEILVDVWLPEGSSIDNTGAVVKRMDDWFAKNPELVGVTSFVGNGVPRFYLPLDQIFPQGNVAQLILMPRDLEARDHLRRHLDEALAQQFPEARSRVHLLPNGPPVPYPVMFRVMGPDPYRVRALADQVKAVVHKDGDMIGINDNWNESIKVIRLDVDQARARALGVSSQSLAAASQAILSGNRIGQYREDNKLIDIMLRQPLNERDSMSAMANAYMPTTFGKAVPISQIATPHLVWEPGVIWRQNRDFAITVQGDVRDGIQGATVALRLDKELDALRAKMDAGYHIELAGTVAESQKGQGSINAKMPLMLFIMFTLLMLQLRSFARAFLVFITGPLGMIGAALTLLILHRPMGFVALLGIIALNGMIIRNSVILIDQIEQDRARGVDTWTAIVEAAVRRFRPIMLTAAAAVLAMIPLLHSTFWGPMAAAIMGGLIVATALTLLSLPAMYAGWFRVRRGK